MHKSRAGLVSLAVPAGVSTEGYTALAEDQHECVAVWVCVWLCVHV